MCCLDSVFPALVATLLVLGAAVRTVALDPEPKSPRVRSTPFSESPSTNSNGNLGFVRLDAAAMGIGFTNQLRGDAYLTNAVAHNGAGVAIGDVDADGRPDIYLCNLEGSNRLYRNRGGWRFEETALGDAACSDQLSTGAVFADVDGDGDLDLLVNGIAAGTRLFLNNGKGQWSEVKDSGLSRTASATSLALGDIDGDGDLDLYCTHFIDAMMLADPTTRFALARKGDQWEVAKINGESTRSPKWKGRFEALPDGKVRELPEVHGLYRNEGGGRFKAIEFDSGTYLNEQGKPIPPTRDWGLAVMFRDINGDGHPDLYVCNDNTSPDRIWINTGKGTFQAIETWKFRHTSRSSMGVDFGDLNRDGKNDLMVVDMLARRHDRRVTQLMRDRPSPADIERPENRPQFNRNTLFYGQTDGSFVEAAFQAGVAATDWTWTVVFLDVDLDGYEDLLVTNGFEFDVMDQDSHNEIKEGRRRYTEAQLKRSMQFHPRWRTRNAAFRNRGDGTFEPKSEDWGFDHEGVSYGMALGDLDGDGDLDLVVNNLNESVSLYCNQASAPRIAVRLNGAPGNTQGIGARIQLVGGALTQSQEMISGGRYLSGDQAQRVFAVDPQSQVPMRLEVRWRDGTLSVVSNVLGQQLYEIDQSTNASVVASAAAGTLPPRGKLFSDASAQAVWSHRDEPFDESSLQSLLPRRLSRLGPGITWFDVDGDGWDDLIVPSGQGGKLVLFHNDRGRGFHQRECSTPAVLDQGAVLGWSDGLGNRRWIVATSNYEMAAKGNSELQVFASTNLTSVNQLPVGADSLGPLVAADLDGDGDLDLFAGGRFVPGRYPEPSSSRVWLNENGVLTYSAAWSEPFRGLGLVSGATAADLDGDGFPELALALEWGSIRVFRRQSHGWVDITKPLGLSEFAGWWTGIVAGDFDEDGRMDLACGNWGRNSIYELYMPTTLRLVYGDWGGDGTVRMMEAWGSGKQWFPIRDRTWLARGLPELSAQFPTHAAFGKATIAEIIGPNHAKAAFLDVSHLESTIFFNRGGHFEAVPLPREAQLAPAFSLAVGDADGDGHQDIFLSQNFFGGFSDISRDDAGRGLWLRGDGRGGFRAMDSMESGVLVLGEQRGAALADFNRDGRVDLAVAQNGGPLKLYINRAAKQGLLVTLRGTKLNPDAIGAQLRLVYAGDRKGPCHSIQSGSGYWSQDAASIVLGIQEPAVALWIRWPGGKQQTVPLQPRQWNLRVDQNE